MILSIKIILFFTDIYKKQREYLAQIKRCDKNAKTKAFIKNSLLISWELDFIFDDVIVKFKVKETSRIGEFSVLEDIASFVKIRDPDLVLGEVGLVFGDLFLGKVFLIQPLVSYF